ncbi:MAG: hypothetical protein IIW03_00745 [Clostridia bacterium]|nr:hypothetical protein [Clostridia bacterium]
MSLSFTLLTIAEVLVGLFLIWGFWNEQKVVEFEDKIFAKLGITRRHKKTAKITQFTTNGTTPCNKHCI